MTTATLNGFTVELDDKGFMTDPSQWNREVASALAAEEGLEMTDEHWAVLDFCRADFAATGKSPGLRRVTKEMKIATKDLYRLFPGGPGKLAAKLAGLAKPESCV